MDQDLEIIQNLAARASRRSRAAARYDLGGLADEFVQTLRAQLDYLQEARNAERFTARDTYVAPHGCKAIGMVDQRGLSSRSRCQLRSPRQAEVLPLLLFS